VPLVQGIFFGQSLRYFQAAIVIFLSLSSKAGISCDLSLILDKGNLQIKQIRIRCFMVNIEINSYEKFYNPGLHPANVSLHAVVLQ